MRIFRRRLAVAKQRLDQIILERLSSEEAALIESTERRLYDEGVGLFWVTVIGLGLILGGIVAMKALQLSKVLIIGYMILGSTAFTLNIGLSLWQIRRLARISATARAEEISDSPDEPDRIGSRLVPNHVHSVVSSDCKAWQVLNALKANATRKLRETGCWRSHRSPWVSRGSKRRLWTEKQLANAIDYVLYDQGDPLP